MGVAEADLAQTQGRLTLQGKRAKRAPCDSAGVVAMACMKEGDRRNTGNPIAWSSVRPTGSPRGTGRARWGGGEARRTDDVG